MTERVERLLEHLNTEDIDVFVCTNLKNVRYLTGFSGSNGLAVVARELRWLVTDSRYAVQAAQEVDGSFSCESDLLRDEVVRGAAALLPQRPCRIGFEGDHLTQRQFSELRDLVVRSSELIDASGSVEALRAVKDDDEIEHITAAAAIADEALCNLLDAGVSGRTERDLAITLEHYIRSAGADLSFDAIVASGAHAALPHARPRDVAIRRGELVVIDWGAELNGYHSDCTRTISLGEPDPRKRAVYDAVLEAQRTAIDAVRAGTACDAVVDAARSAIEASTRGEHSLRLLGHGVGLDVHEAPRLHRGTDHILSGRNVVTIEPGVYVPDAFGMRVEDLLVVTAGGSRRLTSLSSELLIVD